MFDDAVAALRHAEKAQPYDKAMWLEFAVMNLQGATQRREKVQATVDKYGGATNDHPSGIVQNVLLGSLAHFQLARAYALQGETAKARTAYEDFLILWKDADHDIHILKEAKSEYEKIQ
jgi:hypothetical protein